MASKESIEAAYAKRDDMVVVDGVRYRSKDAAKLDTKKSDDSKSRTSANKSRTASENK